MGRDRRHLACWSNEKAGTSEKLMKSPHDSRIFILYLGQFSGRALYYDNGKGRAWRTRCWILATKFRSMVEKVDGHLSAPRNCGLCSHHSSPNMGFVESRKLSGLAADGIVAPYRWGWRTLGKQHHFVLWVDAIKCSLLISVSNFLQIGSLFTEPHSPQAGAGPSVGDVIGLALVEHVILWRSVKAPRRRSLELCLQCSSWHS